MTEQLEGQVDFCDLGIWSGKTYPVPSPVRAEDTQEKTLQRSSKKSSKSQSREPLCLCVYRTEDGQRPGATTLKMAPGALLGEYTTPSFGERPSTLMDECSFPALPSGVAVSRLSQILEACPPQKYSLSARACLGILTRAEKRGKKLPAVLEAALREQAGLTPLVSKNGPGSPGGAKES